MRSIPVVFVALVLGAPTLDAAEWIELNGDVWADGDLVVTATHYILVADGTRLRAGAGENGSDGIGVGRVEAQNGGPGGDVVLRAPIIIFGDDVELIAGNGGAGGAATAIGRPDAYAAGGAGGEGGMVKVIGLVVGAFVTRHGDGGDGGFASAQGGAGVCGDAPASNSDAKSANVLVGDAERAQASGAPGHCAGPGEHGGDGGNATAVGGQGGVGQVGGSGGDAIALAGRGADGGDICVDGEPVGGIWSGGNGGRSGVFDARGGDGGFGFQAGGEGGAAFGESVGGNGGDGYRRVAGRAGTAQSVEINLPAGNGGAPLGLGKASAGAGGDSTGVGGTGGSAVSYSKSGDGGGLCISFADHDASAGLIVLPAVLLGAMLARRHRDTLIYPAR